MKKGYKRKRLTPSQHVLEIRRAMKIPDWPKIAAKIFNGKIVKEVK
jgi:hypothetical protein